MTYMNKHRINRVSKLTGLSKDVIRVWERRYGLLAPSRGANRYRLYTDDDVALLRYISSEMAKGHSIGDLAAIGRERLLARAAADGAESRSSEHGYKGLVDALLAALDPLNRDRFESSLNGAVAVIPFDEALREILLPLQERVGELWHSGRIDVAVEHYVTKLVQQKLFAAMNHLPSPLAGRSVLVACPPGEWHEIGAQAAAYLCAARGHRTQYLGANLPLAALGVMVRSLRPDEVLLSFSSALPRAEIEQIAQELKNEILPYAAVVAGGAGAVAHRDVLEVAQITVLDDLSALDSRLRAAVSSARRVPAKTRPLA
jgi:DNA-binding transcriptional MerR regulator